MKHFLPILLLGILPGLAHAWWDEAWSYRVPLILDASTQTGAAIAEDQSNVPVLIRLHAGNFQDFFSLQENLGDLRFIAGDDKTPLDFHVEQFDLANQILLVWVMVPSLKAETNTDKFYLYFGNAKATSAEKPEGIYGLGAAFVVHFNDQAGQLIDAGANKAEVSLQGGEVTPAGIIGKAGEFKSGTRLTIKNTTAAAADSVKGATLSFWIKTANTTAPSKLLSLATATGEMSMTLNGKGLSLERGAQKIAADGAINADQWQHIAVVFKEAAAYVYVDGVAKGQGTIGALELQNGITFGGEFAGQLDEIELANEAKSAAWLQVVSQNQGMKDNLIKPQPSEQLGAGGESGMYEAIIGNLDAMSWCVLAAMGLMALATWVIMIGKTFYMSALTRDNKAFLKEYQKLGIRNPAMLDHDEPGNEDEYQDVAPILQAIFGKHDHFQSSPIYHLFHRGMKEVKSRVGVAAGSQATKNLDHKAVNAIRAALDAQMTREVQKMQGRMTFLTLAVSGGPFLGLLGTVAGVMITFGAIAASGDVNVAAIAPGVAAALVTTVGGLVVAIPAMFGYNILSGQIRESIADMRVFADEYLTKLAEYYGD